MTQILEYKSLIGEVKDLDEKGIVQFSAGQAENIDHGNDRITSVKSWEETINNKDDQSRLRHFRNHDQKEWVGFPELKTVGNTLVATSRLMLKRDIGKDTYELYKAAAEAGRSVEHSIGYKARDFEYVMEGSERIRDIKDMYIGEVSTLTNWGMNPLANQFDVKSMDFEKLLMEEKFFNQLLNAKFDDVKLETIEKMRDKIEQELKSRQPKTWLNYL